MEKTALKVVPKVAEDFADGIYLDLDETAYHEDSALGSSDHRKLLENPADFWWGSTMNPNRPLDRDTPARLRGRAMHKLVLEGSVAFHALYLRGPDQDESLTPSEKAARTKEFNKMAAGENKQILPSDVYDRISIAAAMITRNPKLATAFTGGIAEVSVFWTRDGIRRKARLDYLKPRGVGDLKSIANTREIPFPSACRNNIAQYHYEMQAALYIEARGMINRFVPEGRVYPTVGSTDMAILSKCAETPTFAFQWVFFAAEKAPITWSRILSPANPIFEIATREIDQAADNYRQFMEQFGHDQMWLDLSEPEELDLSELPNWWGRS